jgi:thioester reductase-like protein
MNMGNHYFFTGFPGFIASAIIKTLLSSTHDVEKIYVLVLPAMEEEAKKRIDEISTELSFSKEHFVLILGDITKENLQIAEIIQKELQESITHVYHLAAIYDLAVPKDIAYAVNVVGTNNVNEWILTLNNLLRYTYFSTAYVSGKREGAIFETELDMGQAFKNHYEQTKYEAEILVEAMKEIVPTTIIRPGIVKGHSKTGETVKFDGPYFILNFYHSLKWLPVIPYLGKGTAEGNFVPVDYIFDSTLFLSHSKRGIGKTYHLTDPNPYKMREVCKMVMNEYLGRKPFGMIPLSLAKLGLSSPIIRKALKVEKEALDYFTCKSHYDTSQAEKDLEGSGISCPSFPETLKPMIHFYKLHEDNPTMQITIL